MHFFKSILLFVFLFSFQFISAQTDTTTTQVSPTPEIGLDEKINQAFTPIANAIESIVLYSIPAGGTQIPLIVIILSLGGLFFSFYFGFPAITKFTLALRVVQGKYDDIETKDAPVTHPEETV
ncbi:MAG: hypothetical protein WAT46_16520, partial [Saprospiraceae bacterium]